MNPDPVLIDKLDSKILLLYANNEQVSPIANILAQQGENPEVAEYLSLRQQPRIPEALRYTVLAAIANKYGLYENNQEPQRLSDLTIQSVEQALGWSGLAGVDGLIVGLQIIRSQYPGIYAVSAPGLTSIESICLEQVTHQPPKPPLNTLSRREFPVTAELDYDEERTLLQTEIQAHALLVPKRPLTIAGFLLIAMVGGIGLGLSNGYLPQISIDISTDDIIPLGTIPPQAAPPLRKPTTPLAARPVSSPVAEAVTKKSVNNGPISPSNPDIKSTIKLDKSVADNVDPVSQSINNLLKSSLTNQDIKTIKPSPRNLKPQPISDIQDLAPNPSFPPEMINQ